MTQISERNVKDYILENTKENSFKIDVVDIYNIISELKCDNKEELMDSVLKYLKDNNITILDENTDIFSDEQNNELLTYEEECEFSAAIIEAQNAKILFESNPYDNELLNIVEKGKYAVEMMVYYNMRLVKNIVNMYMTIGLNRDDLEQEGYVGLLTAINKFDYRLGFRFSTYAYNWIRQSISKAVKSKYGIEIPLHIRNDLNIVIKTQNELKYKLNCTYVSVEQIAETLNGRFSVRRITELLALNLNVISLDADYDDSDDSKNLHEVIADESTNESNSDLDYPIGWEKLTEREQDIYLLFYGNKVCLKEIALRYNLSISSIRQIKDKAKRKLIFYRNNELANK